MVLAVLDKYEFERIAETHEDVVHSMFWRMKHVLNIASVPPFAGLVPQTIQGRRA